MASPHFCENDLIFSYDQIDTVQDEDQLLEKDDQYFFSRDQYFSSVKRGVVDLDEKVFKIYTQALLHYKREGTTQTDDQGVREITTKILFRFSK